ncbi:DUF4124 domain-containing protein [Vibrio sp. 10N.261.46.E12]|uniref:DUF4124 domain-containing protein n=1 Tax=unclassified Vibrio TaxID=2614977 RepID=UPI000977FF9A|nr:MULTISPECIES: DUF4124 domain-containing protein [unclassified Vibrio]OMO37563.1 nitrogen regulation protein NR [Vibrio sp. 10N.261.45.E1]PMJ37142.1 nitrogen regulation protein NR [Vibrio sp. 10N.286.45.B6]PML86640.1 nitrogen regulation protein NR [Vibrio sp. 10N.261.49.E11]PMM72740.1 nitrogen regulation protein NR [Vibrio sp. 10N.261.46.F12]PMM82581.1 nitrogen regulation protein NR [Vibrio sp. 10N.261.46.E8]
MKNILFLLGLTVALSCTAQTVYTWVDDDGVLHFSDNPSDQDAEALRLPDVQASAPAPRFEASTPVDAAASSTTKTPTQSKAQAETETTEREVPTQLALTMLTPVHDQTIRSNRGLIPIQIELNRKLGIGEQLQLILDGRRYGAPQTQPIWELKGIDRGTHTIAIQAHRSGKLIASTSPVTVYLHRATLK